MPVYEFRCMECNQSDDRTMSIADYMSGKNSQRCGRCEGVMQRVWTPVALKTDTRFFSGDDGFGNDNRSRQIFRRKCAAAGVTVSGKYFPQLCRPGVTLDPYAQADSTGDIKRKLAALGRGCEGSITVKAPEQPEAEKKPYAVSNKIVESETNQLIEKQKLRPTAKQKAELRETVRESLTPKF